MELKKAIERLKNTDIYNLGHNDRFEELRLYEIAIDTVLEELNNRIPVKDIEEIKKLLQKDIKMCKSDTLHTKGNETNIGKLSGSKRRHIASLSGRENEAKRILNFIETLNKE